MDELFELTVLLRPQVRWLTDRHSARREATAKLVAGTAAKGTA